MSQMSSMAGDDQSVQASKTPTGRAILLLAVAVVLGIGLLHELDKPVASENRINASANETEKTNSQAQVVDQTTTTVAARLPTDVKVLVANGVGVNGAASKIAQRLQPVGYNLLKPGNTTTTQTASGVQYVEGYQKEAQEIATALTLPATAVQALPTPGPVADLQGAHIVVIVGSDLAAATTTNAAGSNTTSGPLSNANSSTGTGTGATGSNTTTTAAR